MITEAMIEAAKALLREHGWTINTRAAHEELRAALEAAEHVSLRCTVCHAPAVATPIFTGVPVPRCADHMEMANEGRLRGKYG